MLFNSRPDPPAAKTTRRPRAHLWQEGHTAHVTESDARQYARRILNDLHEDFMRNDLAVPVIVGRKTAKERFAGAQNTMTCEGIKRDGTALQMGTSHEFGQRFSRAGRHARGGDSTARAFVSDCTTLDQAREAAQAGVARLPWELVGVSGEQDLATSEITVRCLQLSDGSLPRD